MAISITLKLCLLCMAAAFTEKEFNKGSKGNRKIKRNKKAYKCNLVNKPQEGELKNLSVNMKKIMCLYS